MMDLQVIGLVAAADVFAVFFAAVLYLFYYSFIQKKQPGTACSYTS